MLCIEDVLGSASSQGVITTRVTDWLNLAGVVGLAAFALRREAARLKAFEVETAKRADASLFVSAAEAALFERETRERAQVLEKTMPCL